MTLSPAFPSRARLGAFPLAILVGVLLPGCNGDDDSGPQPPTVTFPSTGSVVGGTSSITWAGFGSEDTVDIEISDDGGSTFASIVDDTLNDGEFSFDSTAFGDDDDYQIRVTGTVGSDTGGLFSVDNTAPTIALSSPDGTELIGTEGVVTWVTTDANPGTVQILASGDSGATFDITVADAAPDTGTFAWDASGIASGANFRVQVLATDLGGNESIVDASAADFEIDSDAPTITLTSPNGGETFSATENITWTSVDANPGLVEISLSNDGGATFDEVVAIDAPDTGSFAWASGRVEDAQNYRIRVLAVDNAGNRSIADESDSDFSTRNVRFQGPVHYRDVDGDGTINVDDELFIRFAEAVVVDPNLTTPDDILLTRPGDTLGANATVGVGDDTFSILVTLGTNPILRTRGTYVEEEPATVPLFSGIDIVETVVPGSIKSLDGDIDVSSIGPEDITVEAVPSPAISAGTVEPRRGALGDLDGDGILDLVLAVTNSDPSQIFLGTGSAGFGSPQTFDTDDTRDVALADVDSDGDLDAVTAVNGPNMVWFNDGTGALSAPNAGLGSAFSQSVDLFDADGDGDLDALFSNIMTTANQVWFNDGLGNFTPSAQSLGGGINTEASVPADFDGDGDIDFFAANDGTNSEIWINDGSGSFSGTTIPVTSTSARDVEAADLDGDGDIDVFVSALGQNQFLRNNGSGGFPDGPIFLGNNDNRGIELLDMDGDGDLDAVTAQNLANGIIFINDGSGGFVEDGVDLLSGLGVDIVIGKLDQDSDTDLIVINGQDAGAMAALFHQPYRSSVSGGQPDAVFTTEARTEGPWQSGDGVVGDVNRDGAMDIVLPDVVGTVNILLGDGAGDFTAGTAFGGADGRSGDLFDADNDGDLDYLLRSGAVGTVTDSLFLGDGSGSFTDSGLTLGLDTFAPGDMDGDGDQDLVVFAGTDVEIWAGDGNGAFTPGAPLTITGGAHVIAGFMDFDQDGDLDVFSADASGIRFLTNDGAGVLTFAGTVGYMDTSALRFSDLDGDGDMDLLMGSSGGVENLSFAANDGIGGFGTRQTALSFTNEISDIELADMDEDGLVDIFAVDAATGNMFMNAGIGNGTFAGGGPTFISGISSVTLIDWDRDGDTDVYESRGNGATQAATPDQVQSFN